MGDWAAGLGEWAFKRGRSASVALQDGQPRVACMPNVFSDVGMATTAGALGPREVNAPLAPSISGTSNDRRIASMPHRLDLEGTSPRRCRTSAAAALKGWLLALRGPFADRRRQG